MRFFLIAIFALAGWAAWGSSFDVIGVPEAAIKPDSHDLILAGRIFCHETKAPLESQMTITIQGANPISTHVHNGKFAVTILSTQHVQIFTQSKGYESHESNYSIPVSNRDTLYVEIYLKPLHGVTLSGTILNAKTNEPVSSELDLYYETDLVTEDKQVTESGKYVEVISKPGWYILEISAPGYLDIVDSVWVLSHSKRTVIHKDYHLKPIEVGLNVVIQNIYFYFGKTILMPDSFTELGRVAEFFKENPAITFEIAGHTDDEGAEDYNLLLSQGRAQAVVDHLISLGVPKSQLVAKGYGEANPKDTTGTKAGKARNRRVEFTVVSSQTVSEVD